MSSFAEPLVFRRPKAATVAALQRPSARPASVRRPGGSRLPDATRRDFEGRFGYDFSGVRVHSHDSAARAIGARAFTEGSDIVFAAGQYDPLSRPGRELLAHELAHVIQQPGAIARKNGSPFDDPETKRIRDRALRYEPRLRPHVPQAPRIPEPPVPATTPLPPLPATCPPQGRIQSELASARAVEVTIGAMQRQINIARHQTAARGVRYRPGLLARAEREIRATFGSLIRSGPRLTDRGMTTVMSPTAFAQARVPSQTEAEARVGDAIMEVAAEGESEMQERIQAARQGSPSTSPAPTLTTTLLRSLCIRDGTDTNLRAFVVRPLIQRQSLQFVQDWEAARIGGQTRFPRNPPNAPPHVDIPNLIRNLGHIIVHEAMHFYVHDRYRTTAEADAQREDVLMEGGAEYLARHVIHARLANDPDFAIFYSSRADQFHFVSRYIARGGVDTFARAYFQGQVELIGLTARPKLAVIPPGDTVERDADRMAKAALVDG